MPKSNAKPIHMHSTLITGTEPNKKIFLEASLASLVARKITPAGLVQLGVGLITLINLIIGFYESYVTPRACVRG